MASPARQHALFALARALLSTLDPDEVARRFDAHLPDLIGGEARVWLLDGPDRLRRLGEPAETRSLAAAWGEALASGRPQQIAGAFLVPLGCDEHAAGLIEIAGASAADLASGGIGFWRDLGGLVGEAVRNAERHRATQDELRRFRGLVEQMPAITYVDRAVSGEPIYVSPQLEALSGVPLEHWYDGTEGWSERVHPDDRDRAVAAYREAMTSGTPYRDEYRLLDADGNERWFHDRTIVVRDAQGAPLEIQGVIHDITDRKNTEQALVDSEARLRAAEARYRTLVEQLPLAIYVNDLDEAGTALYRSPATETITGRSPEEWTADAALLAEIVHPDDRDRVLAELAAAAAAGTPLSTEYRIIRPDGSIVWVLDESAVVHDVDAGRSCRQGYLLDMTAHRSVEEQLAHVADHDPLTGLPNWAMFQQRVREAVDRAEAAGRGAAVLLVDLDDFKLVNDSFGHAAGDALVVEAARRLVETVEDANAVSRLGGDEFAILLADLDPGRGASGTGLAADAMAERVRTALRAPAEIDGTEIYCPASVGISLYPEDAADPAELLKRADTALFQAKAAGRDGQSRYTHPSADALEQLAMTGRLRRAIEDGRLVLHYQPLVDLETRAIVGVEALVRWQDGARLVMPDYFIPLAERTGLIGPLSKWVIAEACRQNRAWRDAGIDLYVSVNLPPTFWEPAAMGAVVETIESYGLPPDRMMIEITESAFMNAPHRDEPVLAEIHGRGLRVAIDDFGTGYSSLGRLTQMAVTTLKIDRSFVAELPDDHARVLVSTMIRMADGLGLQPLAEGIETEEQRAFLLEQGCPLGQGYLFSKPAPADAIEELIRGLADAA